MFTEKNTQQVNAMSYSNYPTFDVNDMALTNNTVLKTTKVWHTTSLEVAKTATTQSCLESGWYFY